MKDHYQLIKQQYRNTTGGSTELFHTVLSVADEIGLDRALAYLEQCVVEKRLAWLDQNLASLDKTGDPVLDGYRLFYESYLGVSVPEEGEIVEQTEGKMVTRWWNDCPTLEACQKLGLDTREICRKVYHQPVQEFLSRVHPGLRFERNYEGLRPYAAYCEEIIVLEEWRAESCKRTLIRRCASPGTGDGAARCSGPTRGICACTVLRPARARRAVRASFSQ